MRAWLTAAACVLVLAFAAPSRAAVDRDPLTRARQLYNDRQFDAAIAAADEARTVATRADSADLVAARAYLERFRTTGEQDDLAGARERLRRIDPQRFAVRERDEYLIALGEALFFDGEYGAAAELFTPILARLDAASDARERVLDWWATSLDRDARPRTEIDRQAVYQRICDRMRQELAAHPSSTAAAYWLSAGAEGQGDLQAAWSAAEAGWIAAPLAGERGAALRADLDQLVLQSLVPARARSLAQPPDVVRLSWERFKERWAR